MVVVVVVGERYIWKVSDIWCDMLGQAKAKVNTYTDIHTDDELEMRVKRKTRHCLLKKFLREPDPEEARRMPEGKGREYRQKPLKTGGGKTKWDCRFICCYAWIVLN